MKQKENESRADYLVRVVHEFMNTTCAGSETLHYDEADCDGLCLADDIESEITFLKQQRDELLAALKGLLSIAETEIADPEDVSEIIAAQVAIISAEDSAA